MSFTLPHAYDKVLLYQNAYTKWISNKVFSPQEFTCQMRDDYEKKSTANAQQLITDTHKDIGLVMVKYQHWEAGQLDWQHRIVHHLGGSW